LTEPLEQWQYGYAYTVVAESRNGPLPGFLGRYGDGEDVRTDVLNLDILNELGAKGWRLEPLPPAHVDVAYKWALAALQGTDPTITGARGVNTYFMSRKLR
jgi:hypothetical protein